MNEKITYYKNRIAALEGLKASLLKQLFQSSILRFLLFIIGIAGLYFFYHKPGIAIGILVVGSSSFAWLVSRHINLQYQRDKTLMLLEINRTELDVIDRNFDHLPKGGQFTDPHHAFSHDIDLFGKGSFYQYMNRTAIPEGSATLASLLLANDISDIPKKQQAIRELSDLPEWRQDFTAIARLVKTEVPTEKLVRWLQNYKAFLPGLMKWFPVFFSAGSGILLLLYLTDVLSGWGLVTWFFVGLGITSAYVRRINKLSSDTSKIQQTFEQFQRLLLLLEEMDFDADLLQTYKSQITSTDFKVSAVLNELTSILNRLDQRNNMFFGIFGNGLLLWDLYQCYSLEEWIKKYGQEVDRWFRTIASFDAYNSLGNFAFNHPDYTFPELSSSKTLIRASEVSHPMLDPEKAVHNPFEIRTEEFFIITGANMAGKSTFLRTVSLLIVMANTGLPVCARKFTYKPIKLITSMRSSDSLARDESYFYAELKRLKYISDQITEDRYFIVLDEILKGTNSSDKAAGSRKFLQKLVGSHSTGIIATHDLSLCEVAENTPRVVNYFFDAEIKDDTLYFDYSFKKGVCQNMNASFLLAKMGIV